MSAFLRHLQCAPGGFGAPSALAFADQLRTRAQARASDGPLVLFVLGEPLSGKSTFVSNLLNWLLHSSGQDAPLQIKLIRWGDAMRAQRQLGLLPADRLPGDLSATEFTGLSTFVGEQIGAAAAAMRAAGLIVVEFPGCTAVLTEGHIDGLDRGFSTCRAFVEHDSAHFAAIVAESQLRAMFLASREAAPGAATNAREATPLAATRINQQVTQLLVRLHDEGRLHVPGVEPGQLDTVFSRDPARRDEEVFERFLPYLLRQEIGVPSDRTLVARNRLLPAPLRASAQAETPFVDQFDFIRERYKV